MNTFPLIKSADIRHNVTDTPNWREVFSIKDVSIWAVCRVLLSDSVYSVRKKVRISGCTDSQGMHGANISTTVTCIEDVFKFESQSSMLWLDSLLFRELDICGCTVDVCVDFTYNEIVLLSDNREFNQRVIADLYEKCVVMQQKMLALNITK